MIIKEFDLIMIIKKSTKKNIILLILGLLIAGGCFTLKAQADDFNDFNGGWSTPSGGAEANTGCGSVGSWGLCHFHILNHTTIRMHMIYYDAKTNTRTKKGNYVYLTNNRSYIMNELGFDPYKGKKNRDALNKERILGNSAFAYNKSLEKWIMSHEKEVLDALNVSISSLNQPSCLVDTSKSNKTKGNCYGKSGYRIILEPMLSFYSGGVVKWYTLKKLAEQNPGTLSAIDNWVYGAHGGNYGKGYIFFMRTEYADIDVRWKDPYSYKSGPQVEKDLATISSKNVGIGYNIIDISKWTKQYCSAFSKPEHYEAQSSGREAANSKKGSGPNKENCCTYVANVLKNPYKNKEMADQYMEEYNKYAKELNLKTNVGLSGLYKVWLQEHPECMTDKSEEVKPNLACDGDNISNFGDEATNDDMLASVGSERGQNNQNMSESKFLKKQINQYCKILCNEKLELTFPTEYKKLVNKGSLIVWPTQENATVDNQYPLTLKGKASCILYVDNQKLLDDHKYQSCDQAGNCKTYYNYTAIRNIRNQCEATTNNIAKNKDTLASFYDVKGTFRVIHTDEEYGNRTDVVLDRYDDGHDKYKTTGFPVSASSNSSPFTIEQLVKYKIPDRIYRYIVTKKDGTVKSSDNLNGATGKNYIDLGYGNLPISYQADGNYDLFIKYQNIGGFKGTEKVKQEQSYNCTYFVPSKTKTDGCTCPSGKYMGKDLTQAMAGGEDGKYYTCSQAQEKFCDKPACEDCDKKCPINMDYYNQEYSGGNYGNEIILSDACEKSETCTALTCNLFVCPANTVAAGRPLNAIIAQYLANHPGTSLNSSLIKYLIDCSCNDENNIVYRVIDLKNPFPGKTGGGRMAGFNWSDLKERITKNRNVSDDAIYTESKVMYHFKLTVNEIKNIRSYNKSNDYGDYKLTCKKENQRNCISSFVHNTAYGIQSDGTCFNTVSFEKCAN